ncbi:hypothetical protein V865_004119 [Kwoniella europaea PYCC6329]|uniref:Uncharacterized protein n=1 Tax=Kwoniella europaea PYCC6329 TaxID=1423913 RepID=A0AAX4KIR4_9TREE
MPQRKSKRNNTPTSTTTATAQSAPTDLSERKAFAWRHKSGNIYGTFLSRSSDGGKVGIYSVGDIVVRRETPFEVQTDILPSYAKTNFHENWDSEHGGPIDIPTDDGVPWSSDRIALTKPRLGGEMLSNYTWPEEVKSLAYNWRSQPSRAIEGSRKPLLLEGAGLQNLQGTKFIPVTEENYTLINGRTGTGHDDIPARRAPIEYHWGGARTWYQFNVLGTAASRVWTEEDMRELHPTDREIEDLVKGLEDVKWPNMPTISIPTRSDYAEM